jgi:hypothetical protein
MMSQNVSMARMDLATVPEEAMKGYSNVMDKKNKSMVPRGSSIDTGNEKYNSTVLKNSIAFMRKRNSYNTK